MLAAFNLYEMISVWDTVLAFIRLPRMFVSTGILLESPTVFYRVGYTCLSFPEMELNTMNSPRLCLRFDGTVPLYIFT